MARLIDLALWGLLVWIAAVLLGDAMGHATTTTVETPTGSNTTTLYNSTPLGLMIIVVLSVLLDVIPVLTLGGQVGKAIMGLRLVNVQSLRSPIGVGPAIGRWAILFVATALCVFPGLLFALSPVFDQPYLRGWHDRMVGSLVVRKGVDAG